MIRQSFCIECFIENREAASYGKVIKAAARMGFDAFELWGWQGMPFDEICRMARDSGLTIASMCGATSSNPGLNNAANHAVIRDQILKSLEKAQANSVPNLICFSGNRYGAPDDDCLPIMVDGLNGVKRDVEQAGIHLNLELLNSRVNHPGYQADHSAWGFEIVRRVGSPFIKTLFDVYHMQIMEGDLIRSITSGIDAIGHFHTAGNPGRGPLDENQEIFYPAVLRAIRKTGFNGFIAHEFFATGDKLAALEQAFNLTRNALSES